MEKQNPERPEVELEKLRRENRVLREAMAQTDRIRKQGQDAVRRLKTFQKELKQAVKVAEEATRAQSEFLANMSHELRTPLNGILGMTRLILDTGVTAEQADFAETVLQSATALSAVINDILDFSKIKAGKLEIESVPFDIRAEVESVADIVANSAQSKGVELITLVKAEVPKMVLGDPLRIRQIILNLVNNAVKFTSKGEIVISVEKAGDDAPVRFAVSDTGIGIPEERRAAIFDAFSQAESSTTRQFGGTGLGLTICRKLSGLMNGDIGVNSEVGSGSEFWFSIPFADTEAKSVPDRITDFEGVLKDLPRRILIVDDNQTNLDILSAQIKSRNLEPVKAENAEAGLELLKSDHDFAFALLDYHMPGKDGVTLAREIRSNKETANLPLILLTSVTDLRTQELISSGVSGFLSKPVNESKLWNCITCVLSGKKEKANRRELISPGLAERFKSQGVRVLLVEDNKINQKLAIRLLEKASVKCDVANNGLEALQAIKKHEYSMVLMDCQMPEMDGFQATAEIRKIEKLNGGSPIPIVAMTAFAMKEDQEKCHTAGMNDYISKPIHPDCFFPLIEKWALKKAM